METAAYKLKCRFARLACFTRVSELCVWSWGVLSWHVDLSLLIPKQLTHISHRNSGAPINNLKDRSVICPYLSYLVRVLSAGDKCRVGWVYWSYKTRAVSYLAYLGSKTRIETRVTLTDDIHRDLWSMEHFTSGISLELTNTNIMATCMYIFFEYSDYVYSEHDGRLSVSMVERFPWWIE